MNRKRLKEIVVELLTMCGTHESLVKETRVALDEYGDEELAELLFVASSAVANRIVIPSAAIGVAGRNLRSMIAAFQHVTENPGQGCGRPGCEACGGPIMPTPQPPPRPVS